MEQRRLKLIVAFCGVLVGILVMTGTTLAWFVISTRPEVGAIQVSIKRTGREYPFEISLNYGAVADKEDATWGTMLDVGEMLSAYGALRPISTYDGEHWYIPTYDSSGNVLRLKMVEASEVSNKSAAVDAAENSNYFIWFDVWIRTLDDTKDYDLILSNPNSLDNVTEGETNYGTFVLWEPKQGEDGSIIGNDAMTCTRIGFKLQKEGENTASPFYIYEPNARKRSREFLAYLAENPEMDTMDYIVGSEGRVGNYTSLSDVYLQTSVPKYTGDDSYVMSNIVPGNNAGGPCLVRQDTSSWNADAVRGALNTGGAVNSTMIGSIGGFLDDPPPFARISKGEVYKMRIFVWLEGQDVDCWNPAAGSSIYANLEFTGRGVETADE